MTSIQPAYGRDYKSKKAVIADLNDRKDFIFVEFGSRWDMKPCTPADIFQGQKVQVRFKNLTQVTFVNFDDNGVAS